ncbi:MAG: NERD domain-containing protein, partial [Alphaproteobacteria bacterium]|nr:NERD domain-containing protein [Alphaproteobacteria bacterium]
MASGVQAMTTNLSRDEQLRGRQNVRNALRDFTSELLVFYNPKINLDEMNDLYDRPLDIVLFHRTKGLMGVAIKSGEIVEENGTLVSQYQPSKEYYKMIDPIKQAKKAMAALLDDLDRVLKEFVPVSVVVFYPDTHQSEFNNASPMFLFEEHLDMPDLQSHMLELFHERWDNDKTVKYAANATRIKEFLKLRSDNNIERVERKET